jgi:hypothetical protein
VQKVREEVAEKERDEHFNTIRPVIPIKQEWGVKEKVDVTAPMTSDDDIDLLVMTGSIDQGRVSAINWRGHQHGVHATGQFQRCRGGGRLDVSRPLGGRV